MVLTVKKNMYLYEGTQVFTKDKKYDFQMSTDGWEVVDDQGGTQYLTLRMINRITQ